MKASPDQGFPGVDPARKLVHNLPTPETVTDFDYSVPEIGRRAEQALERRIESVPPLDLGVVDGFKGAKLLMKPQDSYRRGIDDDNPLHDFEDSVLKLIDEDADRRFGVHGGIRVRVGYGLYEPEKQKDISIFHLEYPGNFRNVVYFLSIGNPTRIATGIGTVTKEAAHPLTGAVEDKTIQGLVDKGVFQPIELQDGHLYLMDAQTTAHAAPDQEGQAFIHLKHSQGCQPVSNTRTAL
ncbi:MAG: hypothetical protein M3P98_04140 [bacterium]|nr:hypothetical protein [bacterium]